MSCAISKITKKVFSGNTLAAASRKQSLMFAVLSRFIAPSCICISCDRCASVQQAVQGYGAAAIVAIRNAEDDNIAFWTANACGTPLSAAIRHPEIIPALRALCLPGGAAANPVGLLDWK